MTEFKIVIGIWLLSQIIVVPFIIIESEKIGLIVDLGALALLMVMYFGLKLIGV